MASALSLKGIQAAYVTIALASSTVFAQTNVQTPAQIGPLRVMEDGESLVGTTSWASTGQPPALAVAIDIPRSSGPAKRLYISPYAHGLAIEYDGLVEFWTEKVSFHNNFRTTGGKAPEVWVGDPLDTGGVLLQGKQNFQVVNGMPVITGEWSEIVAQRFNETSHGDMRYIVRGSQDKHEFRGGPGGAEIVYASIGPQGLIVNGVNVMTELAYLKSKIAAMEQGGGPVCPPPPE